MGMYVRRRISVAKNLSPASRKLSERFRGVGWRNLDRGVFCVSGTYYTVVLPGFDAPHGTSVKGLRAFKFE